MRRIPDRTTLGAKASEFGADYRRFSTLAHPVAHGTLVWFFCFSATFREQKPALPTLEAKRRAVPGARKNHAGMPIRACEDA
jgi:hypothetical protein